MELEELVRLHISYGYPQYSNDQIEEIEERITDDINRMSNSEFLSIISQYIKVNEDACFTYSP